MMDTESQSSFLPNENNDNLKDVGDDEGKKRGTTTTHLAPLPPRHIMLFFIISTIILFVTCLGVLFEPAPLMLESSSSSSSSSPESSSSVVVNLWEEAAASHHNNNDIDFDDHGHDQKNNDRHDCFFSSLWKKWNPFPGGKSDARVYYGTTEDEHHRMMYKRDYVLPCDYGLLVLNVGPAPTDQHYDFEVYDDSYLWSNNNNMCVLYPHWKAYQQSYQQMWNPSDPTYYSYNHVNKHEMHKISTLIHHRGGTKDIDGGIKAKGGDYVIFGKGQFWDPDWYDELRNKVHSWKKDSIVTDEDINIALQQAVQELIE